jgi:hypothetical protein
VSMGAFLRLGQKLRELTAAEAERNGVAAGTQDPWDVVEQLAKGEQAEVEDAERLLDAQVPKEGFGGRDRIGHTLAGLHDKSISFADPTLPRGWWRLHHAHPERLRSLAREHAAQAAQRVEEVGRPMREVAEFLERIADEKELETSDFAPTVPELAAHWRSIWNVPLCKNCRPHAEEAQKQLEYELRAWTVQKAEQRRNKAQAEVEAAHERWHQSVTQKPTERVT